MNKMNKAYWKLRSNIILDGDVSLAERELLVFCESVKPILSDRAEKDISWLPAKCVRSHTRRQGVIGFVGRFRNLDFLKMIKRLGFCQEVWLASEDAGALELEPRPWWTTVTQERKSFLCAIPLMSAGEMLQEVKKKKVALADLETLTAILATKVKPDRSWETAIAKRMTSTPHVHGLHKYKAKFFPRMIRSFLVGLLDSAPRNSQGELLILDPFVGSGTALIESGLLEVDSVGIDIDRLSCAISEAKLCAQGTLKSKDIEKALGTVRIADSPLFQSGNGSSKYHFPPWIAKKFDRWQAEDERSEYEKEISAWRQVIASIKEVGLHNAVSICLSDAITRKFNIRMMGTGVGRFALEIGKTRLSRFVESNLDVLLKATSVSETLCGGFSLKLGKSKVMCNSATKMPLKDDSISIILTSPPYLPASSGRENYLIGKSISITALDHMSVQEIEEAEVNSVGSMKAECSRAKKDLPAAVYDLFDWLHADPLRSIKAAPTVSYYRDIKRALRESFRVLVPGGIAVYVVGKESVFYRFSTREVLYRVACDNIFRTLAIDSGFEVENQIDVQLNKQNRNARPRSLDNFFESVFFLRKPSADEESIDLRKARWIEKETPAELR